MRISLSVADAQKIVNSFHPCITETRERFDGELYERSFYPNGSPSVVSRTYCIHMEGIGDKYYAVALGTGQATYNTAQLLLVLIEPDTPLAIKINNSREVAAYFHSGAKCYILSENGSSLRSLEECKRIERQHQLRIEAEEIIGRLSTDESNLSQFPEHSNYRLNVQYVKDSCAYLLVQPVSELESLEDLLTELLKFETSKLVPMREYLLVPMREHREELRQYHEREAAEQEKRRRRQIVYSDDVENRRIRLSQYDLLWSKYSKLASYRALLEQEWLAQEYFEAQEVRHIDRLEIELQRAIEREATSLEPMWQTAEQIEALRFEASTYNPSLPLNTVTNAVEELLALRRYQRADVPNHLLIPRASHLRQQCLDNLNRTAFKDTSAPNRTHQSSDQSNAAVAGAVVGGIIGILAGPFGAVVGAAIGGALGASAGSDAQPSTETSSQLNKSSSTEREKWTRVFTEVEGFIHDL